MMSLPKSQRLVQKRSHNSTDDSQVESLSKKSIKIQSASPTTFKFVLIDLSTQSSNDRIFFICTSTNTDIIATANAIASVEAIFILKLDRQSVKPDFVKLIGVYEEQEQLLLAVKETLEIFQRIRFEEFLFEEDNTFLWLQLWRNEIMMRKSKIGKQEFIEVVQNYYRHNNKILALIETLDHSYTAADALSWCLRFPFPSRFINNALYSRNMEQLKFCRFLISDASRFLQQQSKHNSSKQFYRGMKLSSELVEKFVKNIGRLICTSWFLVCTKSRIMALAAASSPTCRPDLIPVLFKIDCDSTTPYVELSKNVSSPIIVFDVCTAFRILHVCQDQMVVVRMKIATDDGRKVAREYKEKHQSIPIETLLDQLVNPSKPCIPQQPPLNQPVRNKEHQASPPPTSKTMPVDASSSTYSDPESRASTYEECEEIDLALDEYQRIEPVSSRENVEIAKNTVDKVDKQSGKRWRDCVRR
ncbi:unnamed protein product [Rotaria sordida]|uniref:Uncharacterized protein n=1 Tax=Rotaria sordida TaxID=392033 RepID=A0A814VMH9_9BILA|nr:unnamed protein product [Rotaria sordida]